MALQYTVCNTESFMLISKLQLTFVTKCYQKVKIKNPKNVTFKFCFKNPYAIQMHEILDVVIPCTTYFKKKMFTYQKDYFSNLLLRNRLK
jgi:hypothetical protein